MQSSSHSVTTTTPTPNFLQARCPSCPPTQHVRALKGGKVSRLSHHIFISIYQPERDTITITHGQYQLSLQNQKWDLSNGKVTKDVNASAAMTNWRIPVSCCRRRRIGHAASREATCEHCCCCVDLCCRRRGSVADQPYCHTLQSQRTRRWSISQRFSSFRNPLGHQLDWQCSENKNKSR